LTKISIFDTMSVSQYGGVCWLSVIT